MAFYLDTVTVLDYRSIQLTFNDTLGAGPNTSIGSYGFDNDLVGLAVVQDSPTQVTVYTRNHSPGTVYRVTVSSLVVSATPESLSVYSAIFTGAAPPTKTLVSNAEAKSVCSGLAIELSWDNPDVALVSNMIVRSAKGWPFDLTDPHDVVYAGPPLEAFLDTGIQSTSTTVAAPAAVGDLSVTIANAAGFANGDSVRFESVTGLLPYHIDTNTTIAGVVIHLSSPLTIALSVGDRVSHSEPLLPQTFYYYLILASTDGLTFDIGDASMTSALSIDVFSGKDWFKARTPAEFLTSDLKEIADGGGAGMLAKLYEVMGCWLNLMRGHLNSMSLANDPDRMPFSLIGQRSESLGMSQEGLSFDNVIGRRPLVQLTQQYKIKGSCNGIVHASYMLVGWDVRCVEFGDMGCVDGGTLLDTWDGLSECSANTTSTLTVQVISATGQAEITDTSKAWTPSLWVEANLRGGIGDVACVEDNDADTLTMLAPRNITTTRIAALVPGDTSVQINSVAGIFAGMTIQIVGTVPTLGVYPSEIVEVKDILAPLIIELCTPVKGNYPVGSLISVQKSIIRSEYLGRTTATGAGTVLTDVHARWTDHQWKGYKLLDSANTLFTIEDSDGTSVTVTAGAPANGQYAIAVDFTLGGSFAARTPHYRYQVCGGIHTTVFEPTMDLEEGGTSTDPFDYVYGGPGLNLGGVWAPYDVGVYVEGNVPVSSGVVSTVAGAVLDLDPTQIPPSVNDWVGLFLNPNQNQEQMFEILANDATTVTVAGDISSLAVAGQAYYVLTSRDYARFRRLSSRLRKQFSSTDVRTHVLFV